MVQQSVGGNAGAKPYIGDGGDVYRVLIIGRVQGR